jgi:hypothetical protein
LFAIGTGLVALLLVLAGPTDRPGAFPAEAEVIDADLDVFDEPDVASTISSRLRRGDRITVCDADRSGWLTIDPPPGSFCWVEQSALAPPDAQGSARVLAGGAVARSGRAQARMPGVPRVVLPEGMAVRLLDRPPLTLGRGDGRKTWRAIDSPSGDVRHVPAEGVRWVRERPAQDRAEPATAPEPIAEIRAVFAPGEDDAALPGEVAAELAQVESLHRSILNGPIAQWRLEGVRQRYEALLRGVTDSRAGNAIRRRLDAVARDEAMARDARLIETLLDRSRRRDGTLALQQRRLAEAQNPATQPYDVMGLIQSSSRMVEGQKVFALIGGDGSTQAYLDIPPGIDVRRLMTRRVGVRGTVHYNEALRARLISVRTVEPLDKGR